MNRVLLLLYNCILPFALLLLLPFSIRHMRKRGGYRRNFFQRFGIYSPTVARQLSKGGWTWIRAVSVGEIVLALRLAEEMRLQEPAIKILLSTTTSTGYRLAAERGLGWPVIYSPIDFEPILQSIWRRLQPARIVLIDSDLWPSFLDVAARNRTPVYLVNARLSARSERRYRRFRRIARPLIWHKLRRVFAQDQTEVARWVDVGVPRAEVECAGNLKLDTPNWSADRRFVKWLRDRGVNNRPILLGGSLHPGEEEMLYQVFCRVRETFPNLFLILVPRHAERAPEIIKKMSDAGARLATRSNGIFPADANVLLVDSTGELRAWYETANLVVMGKSFLGYGGQNPYEPLFARKPVVCGPHMENFRITELLEAHGIRQLRAAEELPAVIRHLLSDLEAASSMVANAQTVLSRHLGAARRVAGTILLDGRREG